MVSFARSLAAATALTCLALAPFTAQAVPSAPAFESVTSRGTPVTVAGLWCGAGLLHSYALEIAQQYQEVQAKLTKRNRQYQLTGRMDGPILRADPQRDQTMELLADGNELRIIGASGVLALARGQFFTRAVGGSCTH
jgi:hypothetical protein